jgi:hypothetical protein
MCADRHDYTIDVLLKKKAYFISFDNVVFLVCLLLDCGLDLRRIYQELNIF